MIPEHILERYPLHAKLKDGTAVSIRPLGKRDDAKLHQFLLAVPEEERLFIKRSVSDRKVIHEWCQNADYDAHFPLLLLAGQKLIGEATLHQRRGGWKRHIGLITLLTHPLYRGRDVSKLLVTELIETARHCGLRRLEAELNGERKIALQVLAGFGFSKLLDIEGYVLDMKAVTHDYVLLGMDLSTDEEYLGVGG